MISMKFIISGKNIEITQGLRSAVESKIGKLEKYFTQETEVLVTLSVEKDRQKIEVTIPVSYTHLEGIRCICYNFMPVFDWTRSRLDHPLADGSRTCLLYTSRCV